MRTRQDSDLDQPPSRDLNSVQKPGPISPPVPAGSGATWKAAGLRSVRACPTPENRERACGCSRQRPGACEAGESRGRECRQPGAAARAGDVASTSSPVASGQPAGNKRGTGRAGPSPEPPTHTKPAGAARSCRFAHALETSCSSKLSRHCNDITGHSPDDGPGRIHYVCHSKTAASKAFA